MSEKALLALAVKELLTEAGKKLLGVVADYKAIKDRITFLVNKFDGEDLTALATVAAAGAAAGATAAAISKIDEEDQPKTAKERLKEKSESLKDTKEGLIDKAKKEIKALKAKLKSEIPVIENFRITGRIINSITGRVESGVKVQLGVSTGETVGGSTADITGEAIELDNPTNVPIELVVPIPSLEFEYEIFAPIPDQDTTTDIDGSFTISLRLPIIPKNFKTPLRLGLMYSKPGFLPLNVPIINGDQTIKTNLPVSSLIETKKAAKNIAKEFNDTIDQAQDLVTNILANPELLALYFAKLGVDAMVSIIKTKTIPMAVGILIAFGISKLTESNLKTCPTRGELEELIRKRNSLVRQLNQIYSKIKLNVALAAAFKALSIVLKGVRLATDALPVPQAIGTPPFKDFGGLIFAQPYSMTGKLQAISNELEKLEKSSDKLSKATLIALVFLIAAAATVIILLQGVDKLLQECFEETAGEPNDWILTSGRGQNGPPINPPPNPESPYTDSDGSVWRWDNNNGNNNLELTAFNQELLDLTEAQAEDGNPVINNTNGFTFSVETDNKNPVGTLKRRFAVAKDSRGTTVLKGEPSFSSSDQILIDELVFYIQQNDLKAS
jgi:hypothetical protein|tara:strand:+ start:3076 stop:4914 length:1839 start_codon:yes stop_codon:yes gene_type:complete